MNFSNPLWLSLLVLLGLASLGIVIWILMQRKAEQMGFSDAENVELEVFEPGSLEPESLEPESSEPDSIQQFSTIDLDTPGIIVLTAPSPIVEAISNLDMNQDPIAPTNPDVSAVPA